MSYSFVILDLKNNLNIKEIQSQINQLYSDYEIIYCSSLQQEEINNVKSFCFTQNQKIDPIINSVICKCEKQNIVITRKFTSVNDLKKQTDNLKNESQIVYFKKELSGFKMFFWKIASKLAKVIFFKDLLLINNSQVTYGKNASDVLKVLDAPSNVTRTFSWQGINFIPVDGGQYVKYDYNVTKNVILTLIPFTFSLISLILFFVLRTKLNAFSIMLLFATVIIGLTLGGIFSIYWFIKAKMGENISEKVNINLKGEKNDKN